MKIFAKTGESGFPIPHPSTCLNKFPLKVKSHPFVTLISSRFITSFEVITGSFFSLETRSRVWSTVSSRGMAVNSDSTDII